MDLNSNVTDGIVAGILCNSVVLDQTIRLQRLQQNHFIESMDLIDNGYWPKWTRSMVDIISDHRPIVETSISIF